MTEQLVNIAIKRSELVSLVTGLTLVGSAIAGCPELAVPMFIGGPTPYNALVEITKWLQARAEGKT